MNGNNKIQSRSELHNTLTISKLMYETIRI
jgi:hypothetical protein